MELKYPGILKNKSLGLGYFNPCGYYDIESDEESNIEIIQPPVATSCKNTKPKACKNDDLTRVPVLFIFSNNTHTRQHANFALC